MIDIIELNEIFKKISNEVMDQFPYRFNPLDEASFNENAQSRILGQLMRYQKNGNYLFLENLLLYLNEQKSLNFPKGLSSIDITIEKYRIDILIQSKKDFVIIFENKFYNAVNQDEQIDRYIDKCVTDLNFKVKNVFVIYLTPDKSEIPKSSLSDENRKLLNGRIAEISVKDDLLKILDHFNLEIPKGELFLKSGVDQYSDYLKSMLNLNKQNELMEEKIKSQLVDYLGIESLGFQFQLDKIENYQSEIEKLRTVVNELYLDRRKEIISYWAEQIRNEQFRFIEENNLRLKHSLDDCSKRKYLELVPKNNPNNISFRIEDDLNSLYYGIYILEGEKNNELLHKLSLSGFNDEDPSWYSWKYVTESHYRTAVKDLILLVEDILKILE